MAPLQKIVMIGLAGALGTLARYGLSSWIQRHAAFGFPWGTFGVNVTGCFAFGLAWSVLEPRLGVSGEWRSVLLIGFMGGYTTFSSFVFETQQLLRDSEWLLAAGNLVGQNVLGIAFLFLGLAIGKLV